jgi:hypothetical protein
MHNRNRDYDRSIGYLWGSFGQSVDRARFRKMPPAGDRWAGKITGVATVRRCLAIRAIPGILAGSHQFALMWMFCKRRSR